MFWEKRRGAIIDPMRPQLQQLLDAPCYSLAPRSRLVTSPVTRFKEKKQLRMETCCRVKILHRKLF